MFNLSGGRPLSLIAPPARAVTFGLNDWFDPIQIDLAANVAHVPPPGSEDTKPFQTGEQLLNAVEGPLFVHGGPLAGADRSLARALTLPAEKNPALAIVPTGSGDETASVDTFNLFNTSSPEDDRGVLTGSRLTGLGLGGPLTLNEGTPEAPKPVTYQVGVTYDAFEIVDLLLGKGNDTLTTDVAHGGITAVHGGGGDNTLRVVGRPAGVTPLVLYGDTSQDQARYASLAVPIQAGGEVLGVLDFFTAPPCSRDDDLLTVLEGLGCHLGQFVERKWAEKVLHERNVELRLAQRIQQGSYPKELPTVPGLEIAAVSQPVQETGGDYLLYQVERLGARPGLGRRQRPRRRCRAAHGRHARLPARPGLDRRPVRPDARLAEPSPGRGHRPGILRDTPAG